MYTINARNNTAQIGQADMDISPFTSPPHSVVILPHAACVYSSLMTQATYMCAVSLA